MKNSAAFLVTGLVATLLCIPAHGQEVGSLAGNRSFNVFAQVSAARAGQGSGIIWGGSTGVYVQGHLLGLVLRGTALPGNQTERIYTAILGPRVALSLPFFRVYGEVGGGMGHAGYYDNGVFGTSWAPAWQVDAGLVRGLLPHLDWRVVELSYSRIYAGPGVSPEMLSTGFALHL